MKSSTLVNFVRKELTLKKHTNLNVRLKQEVDKDDFDKNFIEVQKWIRKLLNER